MYVYIYAHICTDALVSSSFQLGLWFMEQFLDEPEPGLTPVYDQYNKKNNKQ